MAPALMQTLIKYPKEVFSTRELHERAFGGSASAKQVEAAHEVINGLLALGLATYGQKIGSTTKTRQLSRNIIYGCDSLLESDVKAPSCS